MTRGPLAGVLLTGGASRRLGTDKAQLVGADGRTLAARAASLLAAVCDQCVEVGDGCSDLRAVRESPAGAGPLAALVAGVDALEAEGLVDVSVVLLGCDYPQLEPGALRSIAETASRSATTVLATAAGRAHYVCACYDASVIREARRRLALGERALRWVETRPHALLALTPDALHDVDTPDDARRLGLRARSDS